MAAAWTRERRASATATVSPRTTRVAYSVGPNIGASVRPHATAAAQNAVMAATMIASPFRLQRPGRAPPKNCPHEQDDADRQQQPADHGRKEVGIEALHLGEGYGGGGSAQNRDGSNGQHNAAQRDIGSDPDRASVQPRRRGRSVAIVTVLTLEGRWRGRNTTVPVTSVRRYVIVHFAR